MIDTSQLAVALAGIKSVVEAAAEVARALGVWYVRNVPSHWRKRYSEPTPWHMKRARVALRRQGRPITGAAALAREWRQEGRTP